MKLAFQPGFDPTQLRWGGPDQVVEREKCSYCDADLPDEEKTGDVVLRIWNAEGWAIALCDGCVERWITVAPRRTR